MTSLMLKGKTAGRWLNPPCNKKASVLKTSSDTQLLTLSHVFSNEAIGMRNMRLKCIGDTQPKKEFHVGLHFFLGRHLSGLFCCRMKASLAAFHSSLIFKQVSSRTDSNSSSSLTASGVVSAWPCVVVVVKSSVLLNVCQSDANKPCQILACICQRAKSKIGVHAICSV